MQFIARPALSATAAIPFQWSNSHEFVWLEVFGGTKNDQSDSGYSVDTTMD